MERILVTGAAGMISFHLIQRLVREGYQCFGCDSFTPYYDVRLKRARAAALQEISGISIEELDISDSASSRRH